MAERIIISGDPGTRWTNTTEKVQYQFFVSFINTCGVCLQYHMKIGAWWPIPIHFGCRCGQAPIPPQAKAPYEFVDYRELLAQFPPSMQAAAVGASNYKLLKAGVVQWSDVVTPSRVRDLREVVAKKRLSIATMEKAGVGPRWAREAHAAVHTPEHELVAQQRQQLLQRLVGAGISQEQLVGELSARLAERVSIGAGAGIEAQRLKRPGGGDHGGALALLLNRPRPPRPEPQNRKPEAPVTVIAPVAEKPGEAIPPRPTEEPLHEQVNKAAEAVPRQRLYGDDKAWIHDVYAAHQADPANPRLTLDQFKRLLVANEVRGKVTLGRADMVGAMNPADVAASDTHYFIGGRKAATFNFVRVKSKKKPAK